MGRCRKVGVESSVYESRTQSRICQDWGEHTTRVGTSVNSKMDKLEDEEI